MLSEYLPKTKLDIVSSKAKDAQSRLSGALRAEAFSSAVFYGECSLHQIQNAVEAEEFVRSYQSKWWLRGDDPNHPTLQQHSVFVERSQKMSSCRKLEQESINILDSDQKGRYEETIQTTIQLSDDTVQDEEIEDFLLEVELHSPMFARDDDFEASAALKLDNLQKTCAINKGEQKAVNTPTFDFDENTSIFGTAEDILLSSFMNSGVQRALSETNSSDIKSSNTITAQTCSSFPSDHIAHHDWQSLPINTQTNLIGKPMKRMIFHQPDQGFCKESLKLQIETAKKELLANLDFLNSSSTSSDFSNALAYLVNIYQHKLLSSRKPQVAKKRKSTTNVDSNNVDGTWLMISPPSYPSCLGKNSHGEKMFTLGRMTFDMFHPIELVCSIQKQYNTIKSVRKDEMLPLYIPPRLRLEVKNDRDMYCSRGLKAHNIIASFTIENHSGTDPVDVNNGKYKKPLCGILTNYGYTLPDPTNPSRMSIWFTAGTIEPASTDDESLKDWKALFSTKASHNQQTHSKIPNEDMENARLVASKVLLGAVSEPMDESGTVGFHLKSPIGGHGYAYTDILYVDSEIRVMRGHSGSIYVFKRMDLAD